MYLCEGAGGETQTSGKCPSEDKATDSARQARENFLSGRPTESEFSILNRY